MQWSLEKIYRERVRGNVPPRKHLNVLGEATINIKYSGESKGKTIKDLDNRTVKKVEHYLQGEAEGSVILKKDFAIIKALATDAGFPKQANWLRFLFSTFDDVNYEGLEDLRKTKGSLNTLGSLKTPSGDINLWDICVPQLKMFLPEADWERFYFSVFARDFKEGNVSVGRGELALSLLTEAKKGNPGDLLVGGAQVEIKAGKARVLSARKRGFADDRKKIDQIIDQHFASIEVKVDTTDVEGVPPEDQEAPSEDILSKVNDDFWNNVFAKKILTQEKLTEALEISENPAAALQNIGALLLWEYGNHGDEEDEEAPSGFDVLLAVFQHGKKAAPTKGRDEAQFQRYEPAYTDDLESGGRVHRRTETGTFAGAQTGTWVSANHISVKGDQGLINIYNAMQRGYIEFAFDKDGVYVLYPGSSSTAAGEAIEAAGWDFIS